MKQEFILENLKKLLTQQIDVNLNTLDLYDQLEKSIASSDKVSLQLLSSLRSNMNKHIEILNEFVPTLEQL